MMLLLKVIWHLFRLCAIGFALTVPGSSGFSVFSFEEPFSAFPAAEGHKLGYVPNAAPFLNGSAVQPPLTSHTVESSPPGPEDVRPFPPNLPTTISPIQSAATVPTKESPGPDVSVKLGPSEEPQSSASAPAGVPLHNLSFLQPAPSPELFAPPSLSHDLTPQQAAQILALPPQPPAKPPRSLVPLLPAVVPYTSASPHATKQIHAPVSIVVPAHVSSLPPSAISPHTSAPKPPVMRFHVFSSSPPPVSPPDSATTSPFTTLHDSAPSAVHPIDSASLSPSVSASPSVPLYSSTVPPPYWLEYASPPSIVPMPSHTAAQRPPAVSPHAFASSPHAPTTPAHVKTLHDLSSPLPPPHHHSASSPPFTSPAFLFSPDMPTGYPAPPSTTLLHYGSAPSAPIASHSSTQPPLIGPPLNLAPYAPPIVADALASPPPALFHSSTPLPAVRPHDSVPNPDPGSPRAFGTLTPSMPSHSSSPPQPAVPLHGSSSYSPTLPPYAFATPESRVPSHSSAPPPKAMLSDASVPPHPSAKPPITMLSHVLIPPFPAKPHFLAPPSISMPYISTPPPNSTMSEHFSGMPPPTPTASKRTLAPPLYGVPPIVSSPPTDAPPLHVLAPPPATKSQFLAPPPSRMHYVSASPPSFTISRNASYPPSSSVSTHASAPSTAAKPPLISSPPTVHPGISGSLPPFSYQRKKPKYQSSPVTANSSAPHVAPPIAPTINPLVPGEPPSIPPAAHVSQVSSPAPIIDRRGDTVPVALAPIGPKYPLSPTNHHPQKGFSPYIAPSVHKSKGLTDLAPAPILSPHKSSTEAHSPSNSPLPSFNKPHNPRDSSHSAPETSYTVPSSAPKQQGQVENPYSLLAPTPDSRQRYHSPAHHHPGSSAAMVPSHSPITEDYISPVPTSTLPVPSGHSMMPFLSPEISPSGSSTRKPNKQFAPPILALPPPPPNQDCLSFTCKEPFTNTLPGSPCGCVRPMKVELRLGVALYTFFPLVPDLAQEIATGIFMEQSQVRIMGANAASEQPEKTLILIDLVPLGDKFDNITALLIYKRFWNKQVAISKSQFGDYEVLYVEYPGLPPSPPTSPSDIAVINGGPYPGQDNGSKMHPLGVDVAKQGHRHRLSRSLIAVIVFSTVGAVLLCISVGWILLFRHRRHINQSTEAPHVYPASTVRSTGPPGQSVVSGPSSSLSFESSVAVYTGSAKTFSLSEIEKATDNFNSTRILGEGGFGRVYSGILEDGTQVAVKVLKREDQQGGREFLAEVEMLSRLHHRNLVKLIGISVDDRARCLIYELVPNGSVESHLHGIDKETSPLDWAVRMKIALGAARGLAYLHEDSSPRVIHRDFKASNILLEPDFTPKVSDFGLARTAMDEENRHISTRVMGTFGYVAPEYAMTGHLLVKSDVYSYGVVLLELLTGRKPVDMSQPPGQENLVAWTRPFLTNRDALRSIVDPNLGQDISFDSVAKVAAIASMCVQPEVSHRPFMGEVVQALKLVCNECNNTKDEADESPRSHSHENLSNGIQDPLQSRYSIHSYSSTGNVEDLEKGLSVSDIFIAKEAGLSVKESGSFWRHTSSGPVGGRRSWRFWRRGGRTSSCEPVGGHGVYRFWSGSH